MKYNNMICDVELLKKSSLKINEISKTGDEIIRMMQTQIESIANDHWTGEESRKYLAEYDVLQNSYNRLKSRLTWMEQTMELFAIKVEDFDNMYQAKFRREAYTSFPGVIYDFQKILQDDEPDPRRPVYLQEAINSVENNKDFEKNGYVRESEKTTNKTTKEVILSILESTPDLNEFEISFLLEAPTWLGTPYNTGDSNKNMTKGEEADCSGFVKRCLADIGIKMESRKSNKIWADSVGKVIQKKDNYNEKDLRPGDVIFYDAIKPFDEVVDHVGFYLGNGWTIQTWGSKYDLVIDKGHFLPERVIGVKRYQ